MDEWQVILRDKFPGYITWERFLENRERARQNRTTMTTRGSARGGGALLAGIVYCAKCGSRMIVRYNKAHKPRYECQGHVLRAEAQACGGLATAPLDSLVEQEVLRAIEPGAIELSIRALSDLRQERERLDRNWRQTLERSRYDAQKAERAYRAVDPENRLVARSLEQEWEAALRAEQGAKEEYERFQRESPQRLTTRETEMIRGLAADLPAVWSASTTNAVDKQGVIRCLVQRVSVSVVGHGAEVDVTVTWAGGDTTSHRIRRPVQRYDQLMDFGPLRDSIVAWRSQELTNAEIAERLNDSGFLPPSTRASRFTRGLVAQLVCRLGLAAPRDGRGILAKDEWWLRDLAEELRMSVSRVREWVTKRRVQSRKLTGGQIVVWADRAELVRLAQLRDQPMS